MEALAKIYTRAGEKIPTTHTQSPPQKKMKKIMYKTANEYIKREVCVFVHVCMVHCVLY